MKETTNHVYDEETLDFARHMKMISSVDRILIINVLNEYERCRVTQLVMETGLSHRQVYYQLSVLRKMNYIHTRFSGGRYLIFPGFGMKRGAMLLKEFIENIQEMGVSNSTVLRVVR